MPPKVRRWRAQKLSSHAGVPTGTCPPAAPAPACKGSAETHHAGVGPARRIVWTLRPNLRLIALSCWLQLGIVARALAAASLARPPVKQRRRRLKWPTAPADLRAGAVELIPARGPSHHRAYGHHRCYPGRRPCPPHFHHLRHQASQKKKTHHFALFGAGDGWVTEDLREGSGAEAEACAQISVAQSPAWRMLAARRAHSCRPCTTARRLR